MTTRFAEGANYWTTTINPAKSQATIIETLEAFGALNYQIAQGQASGRFAWLVRFEWQGKSYRFVFAPLECKTPEKLRTFGSKKHTHDTQARYQMGRIATHFVKAILTAAEAHPYALFGFMELPETATAGRLPLTAGELDTTEIMSALPMMPEPRLLLTGGGDEPGDLPIVEGEIT